MSRTFCFSIQISIGVAMLAVACVAVSPAIAQSADPATPEKAITAGEYSVAKSLPVQSLPTASRDAWLAQVATAQSLSGDSLGASATVRQINTPSQRQSVIDQTRSAARGNQGQGGGSFADFDSLMNLIETTVVPDTWEALGGSSTMAPYPQGVFVDSRGTVQMTETLNKTKLIAQGTLANFDNLLADADPAIRDWRSNSAMRCVSLRRLRDEIATRRMNGVSLGDSLMNLAGLSRVQYLILTEDDIILAAPVGGIDSDRGWFVDKQSGRLTMRSDFLARTLASTFDNTPFGCTIDPTLDGMQAAMNVAANIRSGSIPMEKSADALRGALGMQRVEVFGTAGDTAVALLMVEADRHMKQLALGQQPMPEGVPNYLDVVDEFIAQGPPNGLLLRLWFTANPQTVRSDNEKRIFEIEGTAIRLSGENQRALANGGRGGVTVDPRSVRFVEQFNQNWNRIRDEYPIYGSLESLYRAAAVAHLIDQYGSDDVHRPLAMGLATEDDSRDWNLAAPKQVDSIATLHTVRHGGKRHQVVLASGGVSVAPSESTKAKLVNDPTLANYISVSDKRPVTVNHWWWDAR